MDTTLTTVIRIIAINAAQIALQYLVFAGIVWWLAYRVCRHRWARRKIIRAFPVARQIRREIGYSLFAVFFLSLAVVAIWWGHERGLNRLYWNLGDYGLTWAVVSVFLTLVLWDAWFYWTHRAMHHPALFRIFHRTHHLSHNPSPWTAYAIDPPEAIIYSIFTPLVVCIYPLHPLPIGIFFTIQFVCNLAIHSGYEFMPAWFSRSRCSFFLSSPTSHVQHHETSRGNFGFCFQYWDRLMGTCHPLYDKRLADMTHRSPGDEVSRG